MIEKLTEEQIARFDEFKNKWIAIGLDTKRANRGAAESACKEAYRVAGLEEPKLIFWAESPHGLLLTAKVIKKIMTDGYKPHSKMKLINISANFRDSVWASVRASVGASVVDSVGASVGASVRASVGASVVDSVRANVVASVRDSVGASVRDSVVASVGDSVWASVRASVGASVVDSVWASVRASVRASVGASVRASVGASVRDSVVDGDLSKEWRECSSWGQHDAGWLSFYDFLKEILHMKSCEKLVPLSNLAKETGWNLFYKNIAILSEKPTEIYRNSQGRLHHTNGPAIKWADGYELYRLNGVRLDGKEWVIHQKADEFTKGQIANEKNADIRREIIRKISPKRALDLFGGNVIHALDYTGKPGFETHEGRNYELLECDWRTGGKRIYLKMIYPNFGHTLIEPVHPECQTVDQALGFRDPIINKTNKWKDKNFVYLAPIYLT